MWFLVAFIGLCLMCYVLHAETDRICAKLDQIVNQLKGGSR